MDQISRIEKADMLSAVAQSIGIAIWHLQDLEWAIANYLVVKLKANRGIGAQLGDELLQNTTKRTFGALLAEMSKAGVFEPELAIRLKAILEERNWLVHRSKHDHHTVLTSRNECAALVARLEEIRREALALQKLVVHLMERYVVEQGVSSDYIERESQRIMEQWGIPRS